MSRAFHARLVRQFGFDSKGRFVITQTVTKTAGAAVPVSIWNNAQITGALAIYLPLSSEALINPDMPGSQRSIKKRS